MKGNIKYIPKKTELIQDGAPCHTANYTKEYLNNLGVTIRQNPPHSHDLNPIEMIWAILKR